MPKRNVNYTGNCPTNIPFKDIYKNILKNYTFFVVIALKMCIMDALLIRNLNLAFLFY